MAKNRGGVPVHGWMVIDKPSGIGSSAVVGKVRRCLNAQKAGHGGTLDPLATGILPIALGEATKTTAYAMDGTKTYRFTVAFGSETETDDMEGAVTETTDRLPNDAAIEKALPAFIGEIEQTPPKYSAIKVDGKRAYKLARDGKSVHIGPRKVFVKRLTYVSRDSETRATFEAVTGKGVYIRALARDLGRRVGSLGHVAMIRRTRVGPFSEKTAISLEMLETLGHSAAPSRHLLPVMTALDDIPALAVTEAEARRLGMGQGIAALPVVQRSSVEGLSRGEAVVVAVGGSGPVALARIQGGEIRPVRVLNL